MVISTCTALGTAEFWQDFYDVPFNGPGEYSLGGEKLVIRKSHKVSPPKDYEELKAHISVRRYGYGQMFFGEFYREE